MHALIANPELWDAAIIISAHPGLLSQEERAARLKIDLDWSNRFLQDPWEPLMADWNGNAVFAGLPLTKSRREKDFKREQLADLLLNWSLGAQQPLYERLEKLSKPLLFLAGELDVKYSGIAKQCAHFAEISIVSGAAHRLPWDQPTTFLNKIHQFIGEL